METQAIPSPRTAGNESTALLKVIALAFMFCDHAGKMLFGNMTEMRILGRIAFPIYAWCIVVGCCYSRSFIRYAVRLLLVGLISQPLYNIALNHTWAEPNVFLTLTLGVAAIACVREKRFGSAVWGPVACLLLAVITKTDYGWKGVLMMLLLYAVRGSRSAIAAVMVAFCLFWGSTSSVVSIFLGQRLDFTFWPPLQTLLAPWLKLQAFAIFALPFILWRCKMRIHPPKWLMYAIYPAHLVLLYALELMTGVKP